MKRTKWTKGARKAFFDRLPPDGYAILTVMDQTYGFWTGKTYTTRHPEALIIRSKDDADRICADFRAEYEREVREGAESDDPERRSMCARILEERWFDFDPCVMTVQVAKHFRDRPDTW